MGQCQSRGGVSDIVVGVSYRQPDQEDQADKALYRQIGAASRSQALVLMGTSTTLTPVAGIAQQDITHRR